MNIQTKLFPWSVLLIIILAVLLFFTYSASESAKNTYQESILKHEEGLTEELTARDTRILALENDLSNTVAKGAHVFDSLSDQIRRLKSGVVPVRLIKITDTTAVRAQIVRRDSVITVQDTTISTLKANELKILSQHNLITNELKSKNALLDSANTAKLNFMISQSDIIQKQDKKITKLERLSKILGISTGALAVILALIVAL